MYLKYKFYKMKIWYIYLGFFVLILLLTFLYNVSLIKQINNKKLAFIHIPKNAGTTIERIGYKNGIEWGRYQVENDYFLTNSKNTDICYNWHVPPRLFSNYNPYDGYDTFCIIRNPINRIISEFKWHNINDKTKDNKIDLNIWLNNILNYDNVFITGGIIDRMGCRDGHLFPQYFYIYDKLSNKTCDHILIIDDLTNQFNELMKKYKYKVRLDENSIYNKSNFKINKNDISESNLMKIHELYKTDFKLYKDLKKQLI